MGMICFLNLGYLENIYIFYVFVELMVQGFLDIERLSWVIYVIVYYVIIYRLKLWVYQTVVILEVFLQVENVIFFGFSLIVQGYLFFFFRRSL